MRRSRAALTLFLGALATALQSAGFVGVQPGLATEPLPVRLCCAPGSIVDCYAGAPGGFADDWYLDTYDRGYQCDARHGANCYDGKGSSASPSALNEYDYGCDWDCGLGRGGERPLAGPRIHLEDISHLASDSRHSTGQEDVLRINRENEGLQAASLSTGDHPRDLPRGEAYYFSSVSSRTSSGFDYDDVYHGNAGYSDCYGAWDAHYEGCEPEEPSDLPPGETVLHVARQPAYSDDYDYDYAYDYGDDDAYVYDEYGTPYAANARPVFHSFVAGTSLEPGDLPPGEQFVGDLPPGETLTDDLPPGEDIVDDMPPGESFDDLPPAETGSTAPAWNTHGTGSYDYHYENDYDYGCGGEYDVHSYGDYGDCDAWHNRSAAQKATGTSLRPLLRTASWVLSHMAEALLGLSKSCDQLADATAEEKPVQDAVQMVPLELDYPWPTIIGRQPQRNQSPGL